MSAGPDAVIERLLRRDQALVIAALASVTALAWLWIIGGAGMGMSAAEMTRFALFPHNAAAPAMPGMAVPAAWDWHCFVLGTLMWWVMMAAMMVPASVPLILLYVRTIRRGQRLGQIADGPVPAAWMLGGYLAVWFGFSVVASGLQVGLAAAGLVSEMMLWSQSRWLSAALLLLAALFQLSPLKRACLAACRAPVAFLSRHWRSGRWGAVRMGLRHGTECLGCCWALMLLLFVGGTMNLIWIAALGTLVLVERLAPFGARTVPLTAGVLGLWAGATLLV
jgi:predicted metal-binding membrane protein